MSTICNYFCLVSIYVWLVYYITTLNTYIQTPCQGKQKIWKIQYIVLAKSRTKLFEVLILTRSDLEVRDQYRVKFENGQSPDRSSQQRCEKDRRKGDWGSYQWLLLIQWRREAQCIPKGQFSNGDVPEKLDFIIGNNANRLLLDPLQDSNSLKWFYRD